MTGNVAAATGSQILSGSNASGATGAAAAAKSGDAGPIMLSAGALTLSRGGSIRSVASADLGDMRAQGIPDQAASLGQDLVQVVGP